MRAFLAFPIPQNCRAVLSKAVEEMKRKIDGIKWADSDNLHITLLFLGEIDETQLEEIQMHCRSLASVHAPFEASFHGFGQFPRKGAARVIYSPLISGEKNCRTLYAGLYPRIAEIISLDKRNYSPHITLGRVKRGKRIDSADLKNSAVQPHDSFRIDRFILYESVLHSRGPVYNEKTSFVLQS